jgi:hypothetical protein
MTKGSLSIRRTNGHRRLAASQVIGCRSRLPTALVIGVDIHPSRSATHLLQEDGNIDRFRNLVA